MVGLRDRKLPEWSVWERWRWLVEGWGPGQEHGISCLSSPGILGMVELGAQSIVYELAAVVFMVSV